MVALWHAAVAVTFPSRTLDVWRLTPGGQDAHGNTIHAYAFHHQLTGCLVAPPVSMGNPNRYEPFVAGRTEVNQMLEVYAPAGSDITSYDQVDLDGRKPRHEVIGPADDWPDPSSGVEGVVFALMRREG